jgi:hypothetical protein
MRKVFQELRQSGIDARLSVSKNKLYHAVQKQEPFAYILGTDYNKLKKGEGGKIHFFNANATKILDKYNIKYEVGINTIELIQ